jgi:hypothetical protein
MCEQLNPLDGSRKRQRIEHHSPQGNRKTVNSQSTEHHSAFWDKLSKIWLTKYALRELGRRNGKRVTQSTSRQVPQSVTRPITQSFRKGRRSAQTAGELLHTYTAEEAKDVQLFARHGGPDLSDLRGVCITTYPRSLLDLTILFSVSLLYSHDEFKPLKRSV